MTQLLDPGGTRASDTFRRFQELTVRGFLVARSRLVADSVVAAVALMEPSQVRGGGGGGAMGCCFGVVGAGVCSCGVCWRDTWQQPPHNQIRQYLRCLPIPTHPHTHTRSLMQLPCFGYGKPVESLRARFKPELSDAAAAAAMLGMIRGAYDKWTTGGYDVIQYWQNAIPK